MASDKVRVTVPRRTNAPRGAQWAADFVVWLWQHGVHAHAAFKGRP